jgi:Flp pilus assembly pilin Flp
MSQPINRSHDEAGQASTEYALVLLGAAAVALLLTTWATHTDAIGRLLDAVMNSILHKVG